MSFAAAAHHLDSLGRLEENYRRAYLAQDRSEQRRVQRQIDELNGAYYRPAKVKAPRPEPRPVSGEQWQSMAIRLGAALVLGSAAITAVSHVLA